ncbi:hypothetical protein KIN20_018609 [Parelaphostrongylus tenuis]|uniref:Uncharacterized protein n=1 Tax=Parelaphostrongylus tenuis TaxID=148309 RepID=A0AAD5MQ61_PARTN|nr:hypothetical protein KIN20_018609 [Parelaphostrongylus tenuis]
MLTSRLSRFRPHFLTASLCGGITLLIYGAYKTARTIKVWIDREPHSLHEEMEDFLAYKERQASLKAMQQQ